MSFLSFLKAVAPVVIVLKELSSDLNRSVLISGGFVFRTPVDTEICEYLNL